MAHLDRRRAAALMNEAGIDALLLTTPESFAHATGAPAGVATMWRRAGAVAAIVPCDADAPEAAVVTDLFEPAFRASSHVADIRVHPIWVETADLRGIPADGDVAERVARAWVARPPGFARPETFDAAGGFTLARNALAERGMERARIGVELDQLSVNDFALLAAALPEADLVDASGIVRRLKMVKSPAEIAFLRTAVELSEAGIVHLRDGAARGMDRAALAGLWKAGVAAEAARRGVTNLTGIWEYVSVGPDPWSGGGAVEDGAIVKVDVGCLIAGYTSDSGRTFVCGRPGDAARRVHDALRLAFEAGLAEIRPGNLLSEVHRAASAAMARAGFPGYTRGHFGHGLGASLGSEEWPFISAAADIPIEPGMVLAFETPWYIDGLGGFIIENQLLVTPAGHETMNRLPLDLARIAD